MDNKKQFYPYYIINFIPSYNPILNVGYELTPKFIFDPGLSSFFISRKE